MAEDVQSNININVDTSQALASIKLLQSQISAFHQSMAKSGAAAAASSQNLQQNLINSINATNKFSANIQNIKSTTESFTTALEKNKLSLGQYFSYAVASSKSFGNAFKTEMATIDKVARERVKDLQTQYIKLGRDANGAMKAIAVRPLMLDLDNLSTKTAIAAQKQQILNQLLKQGSTNLLNWGKNTQWAGRQLMVGFSIPIAMAGTAAAKAYMQIEQASIKLRRVYGDLSTTAAETNNMVKQISALASEYTKYGIAIADTMDLAAKAAAMGKTGADLLAQVNQASKLAALGGVDQTQALDTTVSLTNAFGTSVEELSGKINFLNAVENQTVTSIDDLTTAIPKAGPVVQQLGGNVEDLAYFLTAMREGGINASEGANALKSGLASMINPTKKASDFLAGFGINIKQIVDNDKGNLKKTVYDFATALNTLDPLNRAKAIEMMFGKFQFARISTLFQNVTKEGSQASKVMEIAGMSSIQLASISRKELEKMESSPMFKFQKALADLQLKLAPVGESFLKAVTPIVNFVSKILEGFNGMSDGFKNFAVISTAVVGGLAPVLLMVVGLVANGAANIIKLFANIKAFFNKTQTATATLGEQTNYLTTEQIKAEAVAASLDQIHGKLAQTFTSEAAAVNALTAAYERSVAVQAGFNFPGGGKTSSRRKMAGGGIVRGPGGPKDDMVPTDLSNGEAVIDAETVRKNPRIISALFSGKKINIPGYADNNSRNFSNFRTYTEATSGISAAANSALNTGSMSPSALAAEYSASPTRIQGPLITALLEQIAGSGTSQTAMAKAASSNPDIIKYARDLSITIAEELTAETADKIGDAEYYAAVKRARKKVKPSANIQKAADEFFSKPTTYEEDTVERKRSSGRYVPLGRERISDIGAGRYTTRFARGMRFAKNLSINEPQLIDPVAAHMTANMEMSPSELNAQGITLGRAATASMERKARREKLVYKEGDTKRRVAVPAGATQKEKDQALLVGKKTHTDLSDSMLKGLKQSAQTNSDSKRTAKVGDDSVNGYVHALEKGKSRVKKVAETQATENAAMAAAETAKPGFFSRVGSKIKSGATNIGSKIDSMSTGKLAGLGVAASLASTALAQIPGPVGQLFQGLMPVINLFGMLGPILATLGISLSSVLLPLAAIAAAITIGVVIYNAVNDAKKRELEQINATTDAYKNANKARSEIESLTGTKLAANPADNIKAAMASANAKQASDISLLTGSQEFKTGAMSKIVGNIKDMSNTQAKSFLTDYGIQLRAEGLDKQSVDSVIKSIQIAAKKTNLKLDFAAIDITSKAGMANFKDMMGKDLKGMQKAMENTQANAGVQKQKKEYADAKKQLADLQALAKKTGRPIDYSGTAYRVSALKKGLLDSKTIQKETAAIETFRKSFKTNMSSIVQMLGTGQISTKQYTTALEQMKTTMATLTPQQLTSLFSSIAGPEGGKAAGMLDNLNQRLALMQMLMADPTGAAQIISDLNSGKSNLVNAAKAKLDKYKIPEVTKDAKNYYASNNGGGTGGTKPTDLLAETKKGIENNKITKAFMKKNYGEGFISMLTGADAATRKLYMNMDKNGVPVLTKLGQKLKEAYDKKAVSDFSLKLFSAQKAFTDETRARNALTAAGLDYTIAAKAVADADTRQLIIDALAIKNATLRKKRLDEIAAALRTLNNIEEKTNWQKAKDAQIENIKNTQLQLSAYKKLTEAGMSSADALEAVSDQAVAAGIAQSASADDIKKYVTNAKALVALMQKLKDPNQVIIDNAQKQVDVYQAQINTYQDALSLLQSKEAKINEAYEKRVAALDKIQRINELILNQQRGQLNVADALSKGDIAAAANAAQEMRAQAATDAITQQKQLLEDAKTAQINALSITVGSQTLTMKDLTDKIAALTDQINSVKLNTIDPAAQKIADEALANVIPAGGEDAFIPDSVGAPTTPAPSTKPDLSFALTSGLGAKTTTTKKVTTTPPPAPKKVVKPDLSFALTSGLTSKAAPAKESWSFAAITNPAKVVAPVVKAVAKAVAPAAKAVGSFIGGLFGFKADGGLIPKYFAAGGYAKGTDTVPAMLTPGEFIVSKYGVDNFGVDRLKAINSGTYNSGSVYNYEVNVNVSKSNADSADIANAVIGRIKQIDSQRVRGNIL